jgi:hypothetical protein
MRVAYSCVVDGGAKFEWQAVTLCFSLMRNAGVPAGDIKVHVTPTVGSDFRRFAADQGIDVRTIEPFPMGHGYCNKIQQSQVDSFDGYDRVVLCDCDIYFLSSPDLSGISAPAAGRIVDFPNPPLPIVQEIYDWRGIPLPRVVPATFAPSPDGLTIATNWNGGFYVFSTDLLRAIGPVWREHALALLNSIERMGRYRNFVDQLSLALTLDQLGLAYDHIPAGVNFPLHLEASLYRAVPDDVSVLHYHDQLSALSQIRAIDHPVLGTAIDAANDRIGRTLAERLVRDARLATLFQRWQDHCAAPKA